MAKGPHAIEEKIRTCIHEKKLFEAKTLLNLEIEKLDDEMLAEEVHELTSSALQLVVKGEHLEMQGKLRQAKAQYEQAYAIAVDLPGLTDRLHLTKSAIELTEAVRGRRQRILADPPPAPPPQKSSKRLSVTILTLVLLVLGGGVLSILLPVKELPFFSKIPEDLITPEKMTVTTEPPPPPLTTSLPPREIAKTEPPARVEETAETEPATTAVREVTIPRPENRQSSRQTAETHQPAVPIPSPADDPQPDPSPTLTPKVAPPDETVPVPENRYSAEKRTQVLATGFYVVRAGDSFSTIADWLFCNEKAKKALFLLNRDLVADPDLLQTGLRLRLKTPTTKITSLCETTQPDQP
ncbi:MAG: hypothetical protein CSA21_00350 [Deltaproteobacteria bacterium]|nr:MAG: hypothetical protein CSA21_00350 [Deltaproteobacteria bacterium]